ncbi:MAG: sortase [Bacilli bacterium]|nr:sortase [Clostridium sp.]MDY2804479.1 sortase [Bacilli bacterium]
MKKNNLKFQVAAGVILIISGIPLLLSNYIKEKRDVVFSEMNLVLSEINTRDIENVEEEPAVEEPTEEVKEDNNNYTYEEYLGVLDIPKINFYKGFYSKTSSLNNVQFNLFVLKESDYPDVVNGNLIIAGHSGNYNNSYFNDLYKLSIDDTITVHYQGKDYIYKITKIYNEKKTGTVRILRNRNKTSLTLITCTNGDNYHQTIYIAELI